MNNASKGRLTRTAQWIIGGLFIFLTALPLMEMVLRLDSSESLTEKRSLAPLPHLEPRLDSLETFPDAFEAYFNDHFGFRQRLVRAFNYAMVVWLRTTPDRGSPDETSQAEGAVVLGKAGWMFYAGDRVIEYHRSIRPFTEAELRAWQAALEARRDWLAARDVAYLFTIAPNKHSIYPQYLPERLTRIHEASRLDQLVEWMEAHSDLPILDLRPELWRGARPRRVYNRTGTHWNAHGAFIAYEQILKALAPGFPVLTPRALEDFKERQARYGGGLSRVLGLHDLLTEEVVLLQSPSKRLAQRSEEPVLPSAKPRSAQHIPYAMIGGDEGGPHAVVFHDSFMNAIKPFLSEHFSRVVYYWQLNFDLSVIEHEKPDIVIQEIVERKLMRGRPPVSDRLKAFMKRQPSDRAEGPLSR